MSVIIPDTNVILAAALEFTYDGTIHTQHQFHVESSRLLDMIKENSNVMGMLLPKVDEESSAGLSLAFIDLRAVAGARRIVRNVASKAAKEAAENMAKQNKIQQTCKRNISR